VSRDVQVGHSRFASNWASAPRTRGVIALAAIVVLAVATSANASSDLRYRVKHTTDGQIYAASATLVAGDFSYSDLWKGGLKNANPGALGPSCGAYHPKRSDIEINAEVDSAFVIKGAMSVESDTQVFATPRMTQLDLQRSFAPGVVACMRKVAAKAAGVPVLSVHEVPFTALGSGTRAYRVVLMSKAKIKMAVDTVVFARGRTEIGLTAVAPLAEMATVERIEKELAGRLLARIEA
jgi:hypothetical protein